MSTKAKVMLVDLTLNRSSSKAAGLADGGFVVAATCGADGDWTEAVESERPDIVVIDATRVDEKLLEEISTLTAQTARPVVLFSNDNATDTIRAAVKAGVNAFFAGDVINGGLRHAVDVAVAQFEAQSTLRSELDRVSSALADRKVVERAKGIVMKTRSMDEAQAYHLMRQIAMSRNVKMAQLAEVIIEAEDLLKH